MQSFPESGKFRAQKGSWDVRAQMDGGAAGGVSAMPMRVPTVGQREKRLPDLRQGGSPRHDGDVVGDLDVLLQQAALRQQRAGVRRHMAWTGIGAGRMAAVEPLVDLPRPPAAEQRPILFRGSLVEVVGRPPVELDRPRRGTAGGRRGGPRGGNRARSARVAARSAGARRRRRAPAGPGRAAWPGGAAPLLAPEHGAGRGRAGS